MRFLHEGAVFISTLAAKELPEVPEEGPLDQAEILAASIQPIVAFMVLCSIAVRAYYLLLISSFAVLPLLAISCTFPRVARVAN